jgi:hypothetical protein
MRKVFLIVVFLFSIFSAYTQTGERHFESSGNFSICPPEDWSIQDVPGYKYKFFLGPPENEFAPNINCLDETYDGTLLDYVDLSIQSLDVFFTDVISSEKKKFKTDGGLVGYKNITTCTMGTVRVTVAQYFFSNESQKYVVTCSVGGESLGTYEQLFDQCVKTFRLIE